MTAPILYIEDNPMNMRLVNKMLKMGGYQMIEAVDGLSGLEIAAQEKPALILLDINLPDIDGTEVTARLKSNIELQHIPVVAVTANAMSGDRERFLDAGCNGYISKPLSKETLLATVAELLEKVQV